MQENGSALQLLFTLHIWYILIDFTLFFFYDFGIILKLVSKYESDENVAEILEKFDFYILPVFNHDGYVYTWNTVVFFNFET